MSVSALRARQPEVVVPGHSHGLAFGKPGAGKTWFATAFPNPYFVDTEGGASLGHYTRRLKASGGAYLGVEDGSTNFETLLEQVQALATEKHRYRTLVIDSISKLSDISLAKEQERLGDKDVFGASKKPGYANLRRLMNWIGKLDMNVWLIAHQISEWGLVNGERKEIGAAPDTWFKLNHDLHLVLQIQHVNRGLRVANVTKSRLSGFPEFDRFTLQDGDRDLGYTEFAERYGRDYIEAAAVPIILATEHQLTQIDRLTGIVKLSEAEVEKWLSKASADSYAELSSAQAAGFIAWLQRKQQGNGGGT